MILEVERPKVNPHKIQCGVQYFFFFLAFVPFSGGVGSKLSLLMCVRISGKFIISGFYGNVGVCIVVDAFSDIAIEYCGSDF